MSACQVFQCLGQHKILLGWGLLGRVSTRLKLWYLYTDNLWLRMDESFGIHYLKILVNFSASFAQNP